MRVVGIIAVLLLFSVSFGFGAYETPKTTSGCRIEPYALVRNNQEVLTDLESFCKAEGYNIEPVVETERRHVRLEDFVFHLSNSTGIFGIATHGWTSGLAVEVFPKTNRGKAARDSAYNWYLSHGYTTNDIYTAESDEGYHISARHQLISRRFQGTGRNSIVYNASCNGHSYWSAWTGAREVLGYSSTITWTTIKSDASTFWRRMAGEEGWLYRSVSNAHAGLTLERSGPGNGNTVLTPCVFTYSPSGSEVDANSVTDGSVFFDAKMDKSISAPMVVSSQGAIALASVRWGSDGDWDVLRYQIMCNGNGEGSIRVSASLARSEGGMLLDGNQNPPGSNAKSPNGDDFVITYRCDDNIATRYASQWAYRDGSETVVGWHVEAERGTWGYEVEGYLNGEWESLVGVLQGDYVLPEVYEERVPGGYDYYRVVEIDIAGRRTPSEILVPLSEEPAIARKVKTIQANASPTGTPRIAHSQDCSFKLGMDHVKTVTTVPDWVIYGPESLVVQCMPAVSYFESQGLQVDTAYATEPDH